jgi:hypothetical protein
MRHLAQALPHFGALTSGQTVGLVHRRSIIAGIDKFFPRDDLAAV